LQVLLVAYLSLRPWPTLAYRALVQWDGDWFRNIAERGYYAPGTFGPWDMGNVAFFPGYPLLARSVKALVGIPVDYALLLTAQVAGWGFWTYILLFFRRWGVPARIQVLGVLAMLTHPAAFYLVSSYSEPLFLLATVGFLYWADRGDRTSAFLVAGHGLIMTGTRLVGLPLVIYPLYCALASSDAEVSGLGSRLRKSLFALVVGGIASLGGLLFFAYCSWRFGRWDLYMKTNALGWDVRTDFLAIFSTKIFHIHWPDWRMGFIDPNYLSRLAVPVILAFFAILFWVEWKLARAMPTKSWRYRAGLYGCAWMLLYIPISGHSFVCNSMIRFSLCVQAVLVLAVVNLLTHIEAFKPITTRRVKVACGIWFLVVFAFQIALAYRYTHGEWVA
jgi:hypothetical protein